MSYISAKPNPKLKTIFQKKAFLAHKNLEKFSPKKTITKFEKLIDKTI